jgi:hypothetical protein
MSSWPMVLCLGAADRCQNVGYWPLIEMVFVFEWASNMDTKSARGMIYT